MSFYFTYPGRKKRDIKYFEKFIKLWDIDTIVEPFCGWCAFSQHCYLKLKFNGKFILNDIEDDLINFLIEIQNNGWLNIINQFIEYLKKIIKNI